MTWVWATSSLGHCQKKQRLHFNSSHLGIFTGYWLTNASPADDQPFDELRHEPSWSISVLGNLPKYHVARDNLFASLFRDPRAAAFQGISRDPPAWLQQRVAHLPVGHRR